MPVPIAYRKSSQVLQNYDFTDITSGTGYAKLYAGRFSSSVSGAAISNIVFYSNPVTTSGANTSTASFNKEIYVNFDTTINRPISYRGKVIFNIPSTTTGRGGADTYSYFMAKIKKFDGVTETDIVTVSGAVIMARDTTTFFNMDALHTDMPLTNFKKGDILRLAIEGYIKLGGIGNGYINLWHDPMNRDVTGVAGSSTTLFTLMPVKIDV